MSLRKRIRDARERRDRVEKRRQRAPAGSAERKRLAKLVRKLRDRVERLVNKYRRNHPDFNGHPTDVTNAIRNLIADVLAQDFGVVVTSTTDGVHAPTSYHQYGRAVDFGVGTAAISAEEARARKVKVQRYLHGKYVMTELFGPDNDLNEKNGVTITLAEGSTLETQHDTHTHGAL